MFINVINTILLHLLSPCQNWNPYQTKWLQHLEGSYNRFKIKVRYTTTIDSRYNEPRREKDLCTESFFVYRKKGFTQPAKLQKRQCGGVHFLLYGIESWMPIQQKLPPPVLLFSDFAGWVDFDFESKTKGIRYVHSRVWYIGGSLYR